jgi:transcriptional regulator with XRE-family HTH domain
MNQPDLGLKVSELRQLKNLTQEQLAETCEVSTRTIQRIESGEVDPRAYTLRRLSETLNFDFEEHNPANENLWLTFLHLSSAVVMLIIPLVVWSWKKDQSARINTQGRQVLNFQITMTLLLFAGAFLLVALPVDVHATLAVGRAATRRVKLRLAPREMHRDRLRKRGRHGEVRQAAPQRDDDVQTEPAAGLELSIEADLREKVTNGPGGAADAAPRQGRIRIDVERDAIGAIGSRQAAAPGVQFQSCHLREPGERLRLHCREKRTLGG